MEKKKYTYNRLIDEGFPPHVAAGIVGNLDQESGFSDDVINFKRRGDQGTAYGLAQWSSDRKDGLFEFAGDKASTLDGQIDYLIHELKTKPEYGFSDLMKSKSVEEATVIFQNKFERPSPKHANTDYRVKSALSIYGQTDPNYVAGQYSTPATQTDGGFQYTHSRHTPTENYLPENAFQMEGRSARQVYTIDGRYTKEEKEEEDNLSRKNEAKIRLLEQEIANRQQQPTTNPYEVQQPQTVQQPQQPTYAYLSNTDLFTIR